MRLLYKAVTRDGKKVRGLIEAKDANEAASFLRSKELLPTHITQKTERGILSIFTQKAKSSDLVFFTRQLSSMLASGLTLMQSLSILKDQVQNEAMIEIVSGIIIDIDEGKTFSAALAKYPKFFSQIYISLIKAGEASGLLDKVLLRLADNLEKQQKLKSTVKGALMYPSIVIAGIIAVMFIMMIFVIPQLNTLYKSLNIDLPLSTKIVVGISNFIIVFWPLVFGFFALLLFLFRRWRKTESGQLIFDDFVLKLPVFGKLIRQSILTEFARTFGLLVGTGTLVVEALNQTSDVAGNILYKNAIIGVSKRVEKGITIGDAMSVYSLFPPILVQTVRIGEQT
ncbi:MAG: type II secretion system F family protein, partial [Candidatus Levybacteria bacterium]|nr:type II secretion system F family protein [Candidatus Levybacteria bacterium]